jgi:RNA polymerase sigma-70 factor (ECF subfamily)
MTTSDLLAALGQPDADPTTWANLVDRHGARLWAVCQAAVGKDLAEDAFQDGLIAIRQSAGRFRPGADAESSALAWMVTVVHCRALNLQRRERRKAKREGRAMPNEVSAPATSSEDDQAPVARQAMRALEQLPERHQQVIRLRLLGGLDAAQTAAALGCPAEQVRVRLHRALEVLRRRCAPLSAAALPSVAGLQDAIGQAAIPPAHLPAAIRAKAMAAFTAPGMAASGLSAGAVMVYSALGCGAIAAAICAAVALHPGVAPSGPANPPLASATPAAATPTVAAMSATRAAPTAPVAEAWRAKIDAQLEQRCTLDFADTDLADVTAFLQRMTGVTVVTEPHVEAGTPVPVTMKVERMTLRHILDIILLFQDMTGTLHDGSIVIARANGAAPGMVSNMTMPAGDQAMAEAAWRQALDVHLAQKLNLDFEATALDDGISFLRQVCQVNMVLAPGITDGNPQPVTLSVKGTSLHSVLDAMMQQTGLAYVVRDEAIIIYQPANPPAGLVPDLPKSVSKVTAPPAAQSAAPVVTDRNLHRADL